MPTFFAILFSIGLIIISGYFGASQGLAPVSTGIMVFITALWAATDASRLEINKYKSGIAGSPFGVFLLVLLLWIIGFPWYLSFSYKIKKGLAELKENNKTVKFAPATTDLSQLEKLAELKDKGIITDEEFRAQKAKLLSQ